MLNLSATFSGSLVPPWLAGPVTADLIRHECPVALLTQSLTLQRVSGHDEEGYPIYEDYVAEIPVLCEYVSKTVAAGTGGIVFGIGPFYRQSEFEPTQTESTPALWMKFGTGAVAFKLIEGTPLIKKTNAISACSPEVVVVLEDNNGSPVLTMTAQITDAWATIAAAMITNGLATDLELFWPDSLANGWDLITMAAIPAHTNLIFSSQNAAACDPADINTVFGNLNYNNRFVGGEAVFYQVPTTLATTSRFASLYGFALREIPSAGSTTYIGAAAQSFFHGSAPFAALAKTRLGTLDGASFLTGLNLRATIVAPTASPIHPKPCPEAIGATPCSDCATMKVTPTTPEKLGVPVSGYNVTTHAVNLTDCPPCNVGGTTPSEKNATGATYSDKEIVSAAISSMTVKKAYRLTLPVSPPATFRLTINGQQTATISTAASASAVVSALEALSNVVPGDLVCTGGPLPAEILLTWQGAFDTPAAITFTGNAGIVVTLLLRRDDVAHFKSDAAVDTNYPTATGNLGDHLTYQKTTAVLTTPDSTKFVAVADDDPEPPLLFPDGANLKKSVCNAAYRNVPYERVVAEFKGLQFPLGANNDLFSPLDLINGATAPIEFSGSSLPATSGRLEFTISPCFIGTGQAGGGSALIYRGVPNSRYIGQKYLATPTGDTNRAGMVNLEACDGFSSWVAARTFLEVTTDSDLAAYRQAWDGCILGAFGSPFGCGLFYSNHPYGARNPCDPTAQSNALKWNHPAAPSPIDATGASRHFVSNTCLGASSALFCDPLYDTHFSTGNMACSSPYYPTALTGLSDHAGLKDGAFTELEYVDYELRESTLTIDSCTGEITCDILYWIKYVRRVPTSFHISATQVDTQAGHPDVTTPMSFDEEWCFQYGFVEQHTARFSASVFADRFLRPNVDKTRVINLTFQSDTISPVLKVSVCNPVCDTVTKRAYIQSLTMTDWPAHWATGIQNKVAQVKYFSDYCDAWGMTSGAVATGTCGALTTTTTINSRSDSYGAMPDPATIPTPNIVDFSAASIDLYLETAPGAHGILGCSSAFNYSLPSSFPVEWAGSHTLLADTNEPHWVEEVAAAPYIKAMLSPTDWTLTLFAEDCSANYRVWSASPAMAILSSSTLRYEPRRVVARYRLPCNQRQRFDCNGPNKLELISADRTIADWPTHLTVHP